MNRVGTFTIICKMCGVVNSVQASNTVPERNRKRGILSINMKTALVELNMYLFCRFCPYVCAWSLTLLSGSFPDVFT